VSELNGLGEEGWELANISFDTPDGIFNKVLDDPDVEINLPHRSRAVYTFKRPLKD